MSNYAFSSEMHAVDKLLLCNKIILDAFLPSKSNSVIITIKLVVAIKGGLSFDAQQWIHRNACIFFYHIQDDARHINVKNFQHTLWLNVARFLLFCTNDHENAFHRGADFHRAHCIFLLNFLIKCFFSFLKKNYHLIYSP